MNTLRNTLIIALLAADLLLIALHLIFGWDLVNLDQEANLSAWYSSCKLFLLALAAGLIWHTEQKAGPPFRRPWLWLAVALIFLGLSADESASLHERAARAVMRETGIGLDIRETVLQGDGNKDSFAWVLLLSPLIIGVTVFFLVFFANRLRRCRPALVAATAGLGLFVLAIGMEATIYLFPAFEDWSASHVQLYNLFIVVEECGEILGSTLFLLAFLHYLQYLFEHRADDAAA